VVVEGEPGIGKSRLLADLLEQAHAHGVRSLTGAGDAIERATPYHAWRPIFADLMGLVGIDDVEERRRRVLPACRPTLRWRGWRRCSTWSCRWTCPTTS
jgi:predicted ATPase